MLVGIDPVLQGRQNLRHIALEKCGAVKPQSGEHARAINALGIRRDQLVEIVRAFVDRSTPWIWSLLIGPRVWANAKSTKLRNSILLTNLGTPDAPTAPAVRRYLAQFLSDARVVELPRWIWAPILHGLILLAAMGVKLLERKTLAARRHGNRAATFLRQAAGPLMSDYEKLLGRSPTCLATCAENAIFQIGTAAGPSIAFTFRLGHLP